MNVFDFWDRESMQRRMSALQKENQRLRRERRASDAIVFLLIVGVALLAIAGIIS